MNFWIYIDIEADSIVQLQNELAYLIPDSWERETNLHISILPGIDLPRETSDECISKLNSICSSYSYSSIAITDFHLYYPLSNSNLTFSVSLEPDIDLEQLRTELINCIQTHNSEHDYKPTKNDILYDPVKPHITLYKAGNSPDDVKDRLPVSTRDEFDQEVDTLTVDPYQTVRGTSIRIESF